MNTAPVCPHCKKRMRCLKNGHFIIETQGGEPLSLTYADEFGCQTRGPEACVQRVIVPADREPMHSGDDGWDMSLARCLAGPHTLVEWG